MKKAKPVRKNKRSTLRDVAKMAGVGTTTVSRVINGGHRVKPATMARIEKAIEKLGFHPNHAARVLKGEPTRTIGMIMPSIADPFFSTFASAVQQIARARGYVAILGASDSDRATEASQIQVMARQRVDGLLISAAFPDSPQLLASLIALDAPVVAFDRPVRGSGFSQVIVDNRKAARSAVEHLISHGHRRVACLRAELGLSTINQRVEGYRDAMKSYGYPLMISGEVTSQEAVQQTLEEMLRSKSAPTALFSTKNLTTIHAFKALQVLGRSIPHDVALVGFDDFDSAALISPSITVVRQPVFDIGRYAAETLFAQIENPFPEQRARIVLATDLCIRESCGCSPQFDQETIPRSEEGSAAYLARPRKGPGS
jgi:LacI family transcriptional regulator